MPLLLLSVPATSRSSRGPLTVLDDVDLVVGAGQRIGVVGPTASASRRCCRRWPALVPLDRGRVERTPPTATVGYLPQEPSRVRHRDGAGLPRPPHRRRRRHGRAGRGDARPGRRRRPGPTTATRRPRTLAGPRRRRPRRPGRPGLGRARPGRAAARAADGVAVGRRGGPGQPGRPAARPLRRLPARRADQRPRPRRPRPPRALGRRAARPPSCSSATTARSSPARSPTSSSSTSSPTGRRRYGGGWQAYLDEREAARRAAWERFESYDTQRRDLAQRAQREREWASQGLSKVRKTRRARQEHPRLPDQPDRAAGRAGSPHGAGDGAAGGRRQAA